jgi:uncharacterized membrane protein YwzB
MKKSKVFLVVGLVFMAILFWVVYDMSTRTRFPKGKPPKSKLQDSMHLIIDSAAVKIELQKAK